MAPAHTFPYCTTETPLRKSPPCEKNPLRAKSLVHSAEKSTGKTSCLQLKA